MLALAGGNISFRDNSYSPLLKAFRWDSFKFYGALRGESSLYLHLLLEGKQLHRLEKTMRTVSRNAIFAKKALEEGLNFSSKLSQGEVEEVHHKKALALEGFARGEGEGFYSELFGIDLYSREKIGSREIFNAGG